MTQHSREGEIGVSCIHRIAKITQTLIHQRRSIRNHSNRSLCSVKGPCHGSVFARNCLDLDTIFHPFWQISQTCRETFDPNCSGKNSLANSQQKVTTSLVVLWLFFFSKTCKCTNTLIHSAASLNLFAQAYPGCELRQYNSLKQWEWM